MNVTDSDNFELFYCLLVNTFWKGVETLVSTNTHHKEMHTGLELNFHVKI